MQVAGSSVGSASFPKQVPIVEGIGSYLFRLLDPVNIPETLQVHISHTRASSRVTESVSSVLVKSGTSIW